MDPLFSISEAQVSEALEISDLVNSAFRGDSSKLGWTTEADLLGGQRSDPKMIAAMVQDPQKKILLVREEERLVGCVSLEKVESRARLGMLTVAPGLQRAGLGRQIVQYSEKWVVTHWQADTMEMFVIRQRQELIDWYLRRGYQMSSETHPFPYGDARFGLPKRKDLEFVVLRKSLSLEGRG